MLNITKVNLRDCKSARSEKPKRTRSVFDRKEEHIPHKFLGLTLGQMVEAQKIREEKERKLEMEEFEEKVIREDDETTRSARTASSKAKSERQRSARCMREVREVIEIFPRAVKKFDEHMEEVIEKENTRIEVEEARLAAEKVIHDRRLGFAVSKVSSKINVKSFLRSCSNCSDSTAE